MVWARQQLDKKNYIFYFFILKSKLKIKPKDNTPKQFLFQTTRFDF